MAVALFIGRFQPFHIGHLHVVREILKENDKIIIGIGSSQYSRKPINPFSAKERREMILESLRVEGITEFAIFEIPDINNNSYWVMHVKKIVPKFDSVYTGSPLSQKLFEDSGVIVNKLKRYKDISASEIRLRIQKGLEWEKMLPKGVLKIMNDMGGVAIINKSNCT